MPIDFPDSPVPGQNYSYGGKTYIYKAGGYWTPVRLSGSTYANPFIRNEVTWVYLVPGAHVVPGEATEITYV